MADQVTAKTHARLGPSGWDWWSNCPGAPAFCDGLTDNVSKYAAWGTVAHEIADRVIREEIGEASELLGQMFQSDGFDIEVDDDMVNCVDDYVAFVRDEVGDGGILLSEQEVPIGHLTGEPGATGTSDTIIIDGKRMKVIDLKTGQGVRVNAEGNGQGRMYALGALQKFGMVYEDIEEVEVIIVHPRLDNGITREVLNIGELEEFKDEVEIAAGRVQLADTDYAVNASTAFLEHLVPGEKQCKFCPGAATCPALRAEMSSQMVPLSDCSAEDFADLSIAKQAAKLNVTEDVSAEKLASFLRAVPLIEGAITAVRAEVERRLFAGEEVPGFYLGVGRKGDRKWADEELAKKAIIKKGRLTKAQAYETKLLSPAKAEKILGKDVMKLLANEKIIVQADGKPSVCAEGDKNERYVPVTAEDFADLSAQSEAERLLS